MAVQRDKVIASAEKLVAKGKIEPAIKEYERLLDDNPGDVNTLNRIGDLWVRINRTDEAVKVFTKIADHYSRDGFFLKAIAIFKKINKLDPSKLEIYARLADLYAKQGLAMEAKSQYQVLADYYLKHGDPPNALATYRKISELDPNSINVHVKLADLYSQNNQTANALKEYDRIGRMLLKRGMLEEAVQVFRKALKIDSKNLELAESLINALIEAKDYENAIQLTQTSLEANPDSSRVVALLGRAYLGKGDVPAAKQALESNLRKNPSDNAVRESLAEVFLRMQNADQALQTVLPVIDAAAGRNGVELLQKILKVDRSHVPTLEKLVSVYGSLKEETNILSSMNSLAEAHISASRFEPAASVLRELIKREPQNAQHREKLSFVEGQLGGTSAPAASAPPPSAPVETFDDQGPDFSLDLDSSEAVDLDFGLPSASSTSPTPADAAPPLSAAIDLEAELGTAADEGAEDLDLITEHLTEAEVFAKYGLTEKAIEHLRAILDRAPRNLAAHEKLLRIYLDEGNVAEAQAEGNLYLGILRENGDFSTLESVEAEMGRRGLTVPGGAIPRPVSAAPAPVPTPLPPRKAVAPPVKAPVPEPVVEADDEHEIVLDFEDEPETQPAAATESAAQSPSSIRQIEDSTMGSLSEAEPISLSENSMEIEAYETLLEEPAEVVEELADSSPAMDVPEFVDISDMNLESEAAESTPELVEIFDEPVAEIAEVVPDIVEPDVIELAEEPAAPVTAAIEAIGEIDFYIDTNMLEEAGAKLDLLIERYPDDPQVAARNATLQSALKAQLRLAAQVDDMEGIELNSMTAGAPPAAPPPVHGEENLFSDEDDFFDLAAELEQELGQETDDMVSLGEEEQSLEEIFKEFKKGVEQQLDSEDYDTHYNLGIAYKEMGLTDEAIGEFQLASKDPKRTIECCSMLGLCFTEKGMPQLSIKWYLKGLDNPAISAEETVGLLYDLGSSYMEAGDSAAAQKAFLDVYGMNSNYRDVATRIKELEDVNR